MYSIKKINKLIMTLTEIPVTNTMASPLVTIPIMCIIIGQKIYYARTRAAHAEKTQSEKNQIEALQCVHGELQPRFGLQALEVDLAQFNELKNRVVSQHSLTR